MKLSAAVLAGGKSTRMGQNKALLEWNQKRFIETITEQLGGFDEVLISAAKKGDYEYLGLPVFYDEHQDIGPIEGIRSVLSHAKNDYVFVCAVDMPFITEEFVEYMAEFVSSDHDAYVVMDEEHVHPLCAIYSKKVLPQLEALIVAGHYRIMDLLQAVSTKYIKLSYTSFDKKVVKNINTREEYKKLRLPITFAICGKKDSGKTGLIIKLINEFIADGYSVGVLKHDGHDYEMDHEGTDSYRYFAAGARVSGIYSKEKSTLNRRRFGDSLEASGDYAYAKDLISNMQDCDAILLEGFKDSDFPKVEVVRRKISQTLSSNVKNLICVATDVSLTDSTYETRDLDDVHGIFLCIKRYFGLE
ncbi:MAG: molybdopterin-guanine dinucleotide biosynthesis protein B [Lachnospiraceae bacterium]|nr:molybdopterin-guanine dinucleotide biosynthesis protein B [Lachnospiraceae bacterium]